MPLRVTISRRSKTAAASEPFGRQVVKLMTEAFSMRAVLLAAACTLCLAFTAHSAEAPAAGDTADTAQMQAMPAVPVPASTCIDTGASLSHAAYTTDDDADCCSASQYCSQYLSTQMLVTAPATGHT
jgi:hypothetical protein